MLHVRSVQSSKREEGAREAAVALLIRPREELELLLIKRAVHERDPWSGHIAFPGGRRDAADIDLLQTAMRETHEEVGIKVERARHLIGPLDEVMPRAPGLTPLVIAAFVFGVHPDTKADIHPAEVEAAIWVPASALRDEAAVSEVLIEMEGRSHAFPSFRYGEHVIWGLTHRILTQFLEMTVGL